MVTATSTGSCLPGRNRFAATFIELFPVFYRPSPDTDLAKLVIDTAELVWFLNDQDFCERVVLMFVGIQMYRAVDDAIVEPAGGYARGTPFALFVVEVAHGARICRKVCCFA